MTERDRRDGKEDAPPRVRITDKRRVRPEDPEDAAPHQPADATPAAEGPPPDEGGAPEDAELERARAQAAEYLDHLQRLKAEFENYRKRVLREQTQSVELAVAPVMARLLEVVDEFELALVAAERIEPEPTMEKFVRGVEMVYAKLLDILKAEGLERIEAADARFDPELHEALLQSESGDGEPYVEDVLRTGYRLKGRVLRPAGVKVGRR